MKFKDRNNIAEAHEILRRRIVEGQVDSGNENIKIALAGI